MVLGSLSHLLSRAVDLFLRQIGLVPVVFVPTDEEPNVVSAVKLLLVHLAQHTASSNYVEQSDDNASVLIKFPALFLTLQSKVYKNCSPVVSNFARIR